MRCRSQEIGPSDAPELCRMVRDLATRADLPMPKVYLIPEPAPNSLSTAHLFIVNPFVRAKLVKLFSTHPPTEEQIARLESMARRGAPVLV